VGPTILETSFLLAGEPVLVYKDGKQFSLPPVSERRCVDFGPGIGKTGCFLYNLPEVKSGFEVLSFCLRLNVKPVCERYLSSSSPVRTSIMTTLSSQPF
jgi:hypothetical protein